MLRAGGRRRRDRVDAAMAALVRLITDESWDHRLAAQRLRERVDDDRVLRHARARVGWPLAERPSSFAERAAATIDLALTLPVAAGVDDDDRDGAA